MYTNPKLFKTSSIILLVIDCLSALLCISVAMSFPSALNNTGLNLIYPEAIGIITIIASILLYAFAAVNLFFAYMRFTSMFTFGNLISRELRGDSSPFKTKGFFGMSASGYQKFGYIVFLIELIAAFISALILVISASVNTKSFITIPLIPIAVMGLHLFLTYITYYIKYRTFGDLLSVAKNNSKMLTTPQLESLKNTKTSILRGYCIFMFVMCIVNVIATITMMILGLYFMPSLGFSGAAISVLYVIGLIFICCVSTLSYIAEGCMFDNLSRMAERLMIKYNLIE